MCITGLTACGKTELAIRLAEEFPLEVISMDSAMVYRGMDIGTAKPSRELREQVLHHLIDIVEPTETYSAGRFASDARDALAGIYARDRIPLLVGGTLLYLRSFRDGLAELPAADPDVRQRLDAEAEVVGWGALHERLRLLDPGAAERISPTDRQRVQRALEVYELTGQALSSLQTQRTVAPGIPVRAFALLPQDRAELGARIEQRFDAMVAAGFVEEVKALRDRGDLRATTPAMRALGYRQVWSYLGGDCDWEEAREKAVIATRRLAKRQMTWLRSDADIEFLPAQSDEAATAVARELEAVMG